MNLQERFQALVQQWAEHCEKTINSSNLEDSLRTPAFRRLIELGPEVVPLIMTRYATDELLPWEFVLEEITPAKFIADRNEIVWPEVKKKRLEWWEKARHAKV